MSATATGEVRTADTSGPMVMAGARPQVRRRVRSSWPGITVAVLLVIFILFTIASQRNQDFMPLSTNNATEQGTRATAQILRANGVSVTQIRALSSARITEPSTTTVVIAYPEALQGYQIDSILDYPGPLVFLGGSEDVYEAFGSEYFSERIATGGSASAQCPHPDARAAESVTGLSLGVDIASGGPTVACFDIDGYSRAWIEEEIDGRLVNVFASPDIVTNQYLDQEGNAALTLRTLGRHPSVVWYVPDGFDTSTLTWTEPGTPTRPDGEPPSLGSGTSPNIFPTGTQDALFMLGLVAVVLALVLGRRFGSLVAEPLPVIVPSSESTRGRARLYRKYRSYGRATASLRAATAVRVARRIGVPRGAEQAAFVDAVARASGRSREHVQHVFYGPPATDESSMHAIVSSLDQLESEVHRP